MTDSDYCEMQIAVQLEALVNCRLFPMTLDEAEAELIRIVKYVVREYKEGEQT